MDTEMNIQNKGQLEFAVFCIENIAIRLGVSAEGIYQALKDSNILNGYIVPEYGVLCTQSKDYIVNDILMLIQERGIRI